MASGVSQGDGMAIGELPPRGVKESEGGKELKGLKGVKRRKDTGKPYVEVRYRGGKFFSSQIETMEEGALVYDIIVRYLHRGSTTGGIRGKRQAPPKLNYPEYSLTLPLDELPIDFGILGNKEGALEVILKQAKAAVKKLPKSQEHSVQVVASQSTNNVSPPYQTPFDHPTFAAEDQPDLPAVSTNTELLRHIYEVACFFVVCEREELEIKVADMKEGSGIIGIPMSRLYKLQNHMASIKQSISRDGQDSWPLQAYEEAYLSEESKCRELRKILDDHNLKSISESLLGDGTRETAHLRATHPDRLPKVPEICTTEEQNKLSESSNCPDLIFNPRVYKEVTILKFG